MARRENGSFIPLIMTTGGAFSTEAINAIRKITKIKAERKGKRRSEVARTIRARFVSSSFEQNLCV